MSVLERNLLRHSYTEENYFDKIVEKFNSSAYAENVDKLLAKSDHDADLHRHHSFVLEWLQELPPEGLNRLDGIDAWRIGDSRSNSPSSRFSMLAEFHEFRRSHIAYVWLLTIIPAIIILWVLLFLTTDSPPCFSGRGAYLSPCSAARDIHPSVYISVFIGQCVPLWNLARKYSTLWKAQRILSEAIDYVLDRLQDSAQEQVAPILQTLRSSEPPSAP